MKNSFLKTASGYLLGIVLFLFIISRAKDGLSEVAKSDISVDWIIFFAGVVFFLSVYFLDVKIWKAILNSLKIVHLNYFSLFKIWVFSILGKYIPGKVWYIGARACMVSKDAREAVSLSSFIEAEYLSLSSLMWGLLYIFEIKGYFSNYISVLLFLALFLAMPYVISVSNIAFKSVIDRLTGDRYKNMQIDIKYYKSLLLFSAFFVIWFLNGVFIVIIGKSIGINLERDLITVTGMFTLSFIAGFLVFIVPSGLGVRESVFAYFLTSIIGAPLAIILSLLVRVGMVMAEILIISITFLFRKK